MNWYQTEMFKKIIIINKYSCLSHPRYIQNCQMNQFPLRSSLTNIRELFVVVFGMFMVCYESSQFWPAVINGTALAFSGGKNHPFPSFWGFVLFLFGFSV